MVLGGPVLRVAGLVGLVLTCLFVGVPLEQYLEMLISSYWPAFLAAAAPYLGRTLTIFATAIAGLAGTIWLLGLDLGWLLAYTVTHHRWVLACILMPISVVFDGFMNLRVRCQRDPALQSLAS